MRKIESKIISLHSKFKLFIVFVKLGKIPNLEKKRKTEPGYCSYWILYFSILSEINIYKRKEIFVPAI